jgi:hypothetical protein
MVFVLFVLCGCPVAVAVGKAVGEAVAVEAIADTATEVITTTEVMEAAVVCPSVFVVLAPFTAPCNAKTTLCV